MTKKIKNFKKSVLEIVACNCGGRGADGRCFCRKSFSMPLKGIGGVINSREAELLSMLKEVLEMAIYENEFNRLTAFMDDRLFNLPAIKLNGKRLREIRKKLNL